MNNNVVIAIFDVESEAFQAFSELRKMPAGEGYFVPEAALIKNKDNAIELCESFGTGSPDAGTTTGIVVGSLVGVLGGPIGVILGAATGAWAGGVSDADYALDTASAVAVVASKIYEGEIAIAALVSEDEPAFDAAFDGYKTTIVRYDAADIAADVDRLYDLGAEISNQVLAEVKAERKAEREDLREELHAKIKAQFEEYEAATNRSMGME
ncbi:MAG: DUF1269 domain-containing protein [Eggerthellaceae bacterium]|nr:DUF1269 domain-containing protein [Eggerthellaceae bacterium]